MALFRNLILIALSNIILCQTEAIRAIIVSNLISGSYSDVNNNKFENNKNSTFKHFSSFGSMDEAYYKLLLYMCRCYTNYTS